jgi:hypothetical protein
MGVNKRQWVWREASLMSLTCVFKVYGVSRLET